MAGALPTESNIQMTGQGVVGRSASGAGLSRRFDPSDLRTFGVVYSTSEVDSLLSGKAASSHTHAQSDVTGLVSALAAKADLVGGLVPAGQLPSYVDDVIEAANFAALPGTGESGKLYVTLDDSRVYRWSGSAYVELTDSTAVWGSISGTLSNQTDLNSALSGKAATTVTISAGTGLSGGGDLSANRSFAVDYGTSGTTACVGNDARLSDSRTPTAHATSHKSGGGDAIKLDELAAPTDVTTLNASASAHGLLPKLSNNAAEFLNGSGAWSAPSAAGDVVGPSSATDNAIARFDGTTGKLIQNLAGATLSDSAQLSLACGTITTSQPMTITQTWNSGGVAFNSILVDITNTASAAASVVIDMKVDGSSVFSVTKAGGLKLSNASTTLTSSSVAFISSGGLEIYNGGSRSGYWNWDGLTIRSDSVFSFASSTAVPQGNGDTRLYRGGAGIFQQRNGTNAQCFEVFTTYTSSTSHELCRIKGKAGANFEFGPSNGSGGGTLRGLTIGGYSGGSSTITPWLTFDNAGKADFAAPVSAGVYTFATVPTASGFSGSAIRISDRAQRWAYSDGTDWRFFADDVVIS